MLTVFVFSIIGLNIGSVNLSENNADTTIEEPDFIPADDPSRDRDHEGDTFSVVAYDPISGQVGGAACSCVGFNGGIDFLNDLIVDSGGNIIGGINSQAAYNASTQAIARTRMLAGDTPQQIITFVVAADGGSASRQYGVVGFNGPNLETAGFTGSSNGHFAGHLGGTEPGTGITYAIQGNILDNNNGSDNVNGQDLLNDMETSFLGAEGTLADKLMAALQGAKRAAGDSRCNNTANSGRTAFVRVLSPGEGDNNPGLYYNTDDIPGNATTSGVPSFTEPIDKLQDLYDDGEGLGFCRETVTTFPYIMDFETSMWLRENPDAAVNDNDRSWMRDRSSTPTGGTGPSSANQGTFFAYLEASSISGAGNEATIASPCFEIPLVSNAQITFDYHMLGGNMGTMRLEANNGSGWVQLWSRVGAQGSSWFNDEVVDLTAYSQETIKLRFRGNRNGGNAGDMAIDDIQITVTPIVTCTGATKTWNGSSWSPSGSPSIDDIAIINGNYNTLTHGNLTACTLTINSGNTLTINANGFANIDGDIDVNGTSTLIIEHEGIVVQTDSNASVNKDVTATINVEITTPILSNRDFMVMGSPMDSEERTGVFASAFLVLNSTPANFMPHSGVPMGGTNFADDKLINGKFWDAYPGAINVGEGFIVRPQTSYTDPAVTSYDMTYELGTLNNGDVSRSIIFNGLGDNPTGTPNILANPYASPISATALVTDNALINEIYFWEHLTSPSTSIPGSNNMNFSMDDISIYNNSMPLPAVNDPGISTTPNGVISTGQGFAIKAQAGGMVTFTNSMRLTSGNNTLRNPETEAQIDRLMLEVRNADYGVGSYTGVAFNPVATTQVDPGYDTDRLATVVSLFSHLQDGSEQLAIQTMPEFNDAMKIPLGFTTQVDDELEYVISIANAEGNQITNMTVYLVDNLLNTTTNLSQLDYAFRSGKDTYTNRFTLLFESRLLGSNDNILDTIAIFPNPTEGIITISSPHTVIHSVEVYDISGRSVVEILSSEDNQYTLNLASLGTTIYFVKVNTEAGTTTKKIIKK